MAGIIAPRDDGRRVVIAAGDALARRLTVYAQNVRDGRVPAPPRSRAKEIAALSRAFEEIGGTRWKAGSTSSATHRRWPRVKAPLAAIRGASRAAR